MPKETISNPNEGGLVRLKYTFRFRDQFIEPDDDWLKCVENTSDELLGAYSKSEDNALSAAFGSQKKRLNRVFDAIGFMYLDYRYPPRGQKRKSGTSGKEVASAASSEPAPKKKKVKVLTHRPRYIEPAIVPDFGGETSSATEAERPALTQRIEESAALPKADKIEDPRPEETKTLEILSPSVGVEAPKIQKDLAATPKRKRMASVLDVLETIKTSSSTPEKIAKASKAQVETETKLTEAEATMSQADAKTGPWEPIKEKSSEIGEKTAEKEAIEQILPKKSAASTPEALKENTEYIIRHASGKNLSKEEKREAQYYAQKLKYPKGALVFNDSGEEDFLYCLPDSKEISVCPEMSRSFGFSTLEDGLSVLSKDELSDSLAYNSLKVWEWIFCT
jgi:hypothetical protein